MRNQWRALFPPACFATCARSERAPTARSREKQLLSFVLQNNRSQCHSRFPVERAARLRKHPINFKAHRAYHCWFSSGLLMEINWSRLKLSRNFYITRSEEISLSSSQLCWWYFMAWKQTRGTHLLNFIVHIQKFIFYEKSGPRTKSIRLIGHPGKIVEHSWELVFPKRFATE